MRGNVIKEGDKVNKLLLLTCAAFVVTCVFGAKRSEQSVMVDLGGATVTSEGDDVAKVIGRGVGISETEALKDAYRDAVERAVGLFLDAEIVVQKDQVLKDQILASSA